MKSYTPNKKCPWKIVDIVMIYLTVFAFSIFLWGLMYAANIDLLTNSIPIIIQLLLSFLTFSIVYFIITKKYNLSFRKVMGIHSANFPMYTEQGIFSFLILIAASSLINFFYYQFNPLPESNPYRNFGTEEMFYFSIIAVFVAPFVEEILFRGFIQPAMIERLGKIGGILLTAMIFGVSHSQYAEYDSALISVTAVGLILGITRDKTGSIIPCIIAHLLNNLIASVSFFN